MTKAEFRDRHSEIIEKYQNIEMHLRGICAALLANKDDSWFKKLDEHETDTLGELIKKIQFLQNQKQLELFTPEDIETLNQIRKSRNYWVHQCFIDPNLRTVTFRKDETIKHTEIAQRINSDLRTAVEWNEKITEIEKPLILSVGFF